MTDFHIFPAIDLLDGKAVRLVKGIRDSATTVGDALSLAADFHAAHMLHVVELDGAFAGSPQQHELIGALAKKHRVQAGGGVRTLEDIDALFRAGVDRVVVGTAILTHDTFADDIARTFDLNKIVIAIDVKDGHVAVSGWTSASKTLPRDLAHTLANKGFIHILTTAVHKDGTLEGPDVAVLDDVRGADARLQVIASGGIGSLDDIDSVKHCAGVVVGKAMYAKRFTLAEALARVQSW
jgi:phosphoribosylformimino-5-aminoimidazole carboxamide ribotide isomerase